MQINILFPIVDRSPTGGQKVIYEYCNQLIHDGIQVRLYYLPGSMFSKFHFPEPIRIALLQLYMSTVGTSNWFKMDRRIKKYVIRDACEMKSADVVMATAVETAEPIYKLPSSYGKKAYFIQGYENWHYSDNYVNSSYAFGMKNMVVSNWLKEKVDKYGKEPAVLISNGINTNIFRTTGLERKRHSVVLQYRSTEYKGGKYALETIEILKEKYPDLTVNIISTEEKSNLIPEWCNYFFKASAQQVADINNQSEVFICSTIDEGFGLPGLEAMACGCAVASTDYTGVHDYAIDGVNALLSPVKDAKALANNAIRLFEDDYLRKKIIHAGIETGMRRTMNNSYRKFKQTLKDIVEEQ